MESFPKVVVPACSTTNPVFTFGTCGLHSLDKEKRSSRRIRQNINSRFTGSNHRTSSGKDLGNECTKPATLGDPICGQDPRMEISKLRGEISILKEEPNESKLRQNERRKEPMLIRIVLDMQKELEATIKQRWTYFTPAERAHFRQQNVSLKNWCTPEKWQLFMMIQRNRCNSGRAQKPWFFSVHAEMYPDFWKILSILYKDCSFYSGSIGSLAYDFPQTGTDCGWLSAFPGSLGWHCRICHTGSRDISSREAKRKEKEDDYGYAQNKTKLQGRTVQSIHSDLWRFWNRENEFAATAAQIPSYSEKLSGWIWKKWEGHNSFHGTLRRGTY